MPNHITNIMTITGPGEDRHRLFKHIKSYDPQTNEELSIDFNKISPEPDIPYQAREEDRWIIKLWEEEKHKTLDTFLLELCHQYVDQMLDKNHKIHTAIKLFNFYIKYGVDNGYDWNRNYWGTKWNAYSQFQDGETIYFDTAWSTPLPVIQELSRQFSTLTIKIEYADEDMGYNCGYYECQAGFLLLEVNCHDLDEQEEDGALKFACKIKGEDYNDLLRERNQDCE